MQIQVCNQCSQSPTACYCKRGGLAGLGFHDFKPYTTKGWECPKCQAVMAPTAPTCFYCKPAINFTSITTGGING